MTETVQKQAANAQAATGLTGLKIIWEKLKLSKDTLLITRFHEILGSPSKNTFTAILKHPGDRISANKMTALVQFIEQHWPECASSEFITKAH
ncbi:MAG: hypothetical protein ABL951_04140 [Alphaproteobacteria bacterium]